MGKQRNLLLILMMTVILGLTGTAGVSAGTGPRDVKGLQGQRDGRVTLASLSAAAKKDQEKYMPHAALVMFKSTKAVNKKKAGQVLQSGEDAVGDAQIEAVWSFDGDPVTTASDSGTRKQLGKGGSAAASYTSVALVKSGKLSTPQLVKKLRAREDVLYAEPNYRIHACSVNDPYFRYQWSMQGGTAGTAAYADNTPNVGAVWDQGTTGTDRIVAVVDTGVDYTHPDLAANMWHNTHYPKLKGEYGFDFSAGDGDPMDENGHGTHCAGIIGAQGGNGIGTAGVNQGVRIMALRILDAEGSAYLSHEVAAYNYINKAIDLGEPVQAINNSWGGGEYSEIFETLVNQVGSKGAITVCAAGNDGADNDVNAEYPSGIESPYLISVAATREDGELVSFSNYGKESVDVAAPGTDILSTVSYDCYNPAIYGSGQASLSAAYNDYESGSGPGSVSALQSSLYLNGEKYTGGAGKAQISISTGDRGFLTKAGHCAQIKIRKMKPGDLVCMTIPYEISADAKSAPAFSVMAQAGGSSQDSGILGVTDTVQGEDLSIATMGEMSLLGGTYTDEGEPDNWSHISSQVMDEDDLDYYKELAREAAGTAEDPDPLKRQIVILAYAYEKGSMTIRLDDMGLSRQDLVGTEAFGKYDFMSGTSMATPFVTGSVALQAAADGTAYQDLDAEDLVNRIASMAKPGSMEVMARGSFDFTKKPAELPPRIDGIRVDKAGGTITITGSGLKPSSGLTVQIGPSEARMQTAAIQSQTDREITVRDDGWINNVENIRITGYGGKTASRSDLYLVSGKKAFKCREGVDDLTTTEAMATDGKKLYNLDSSTGTIWKMSPGNPASMKMLARINPNRIFGAGAGANPNASYAVRFSDDLVCMKGKLYTVVEYGEADASEAQDDDFGFFGRKTGKRAGKKDEVIIIFGDEEEESGDMAIYSSQLRLISIDVKKGKVKNLGKLPSDLESVTDYAMAAYKGKLYFMGGYSYRDQALTRQVKVFNPKARKKKRWSSAASLPEVRAGGKAVTSGGRLVYTLGFSQPVDAGWEDADYRFPANLIYNGKGWTVSEAVGVRGIEPLVLGDTIRRGGKEYPSFDVSVSAVKGGLVYLGMPAANLGDAFLYKVSSDKFTDSGINFAPDLDTNEIRGIAVKNTLYGYDGEHVYSVRLK